MPAARKGSLPLPKGLFSSEAMFVGESVGVEVVVKRIVAVLGAETDLQS